MAHALLAVSRSSRRASPPSIMSQQTDDGSSSQATSSNSINNNTSSSRRSFDLRHQYSITSASTSSTLYTCSEEDEEDLDRPGNANGYDPLIGACDEVIQDARLNGAGLPIPWQHEGNDASTSSSPSSSRRSRERAANHAMRFKRRGASSRASLTTLGEEWLPRSNAVSNDSPNQSPIKSLSQASASSPAKTSNSSCTCHLEEEENTSDIEGYGESEGCISIDDQLDKMIKMTSDLLRISKGVLTSSKRVSVMKASESQIQYSHEHALRQHLESLETQDRFMHFISNEAHSILSATGEDSQPSLTSLHGNLPHSHAAPPLSRARLRPHSSNGSISAPVIRATTMYVNAEMGGASSGHTALPGTSTASRERHASSTSHVTGSSGLGSVKEEMEAVASKNGEGENEAHQQDDTAAVSTSTPYHAHVNKQVSKAVSRKPSQLSDISVASSSGLPAPASALNQAVLKSGVEATSATMLSPTLSTATVTSSTPSSSSTFFSSFWSRSTNASSSSSVSSSTSTPNTTMEASPSLSRFLARKSAPPPLAHSKADQEPAKKDAKEMLSALAASSPPLLPPQPEPDSTHLSPTTADSLGPNSLVPPLSPTVSAASTSQSSLPSQGQPFEARSPPQLPASSSTAALAQLSAIYSSPHLTVSSRPRHRASLSESLLRASWSGTNLKGDATSSSPSGPSGAPGKTGDKSHKRSRHSTSPAMQFVVKKSDVPVHHKRERSGRELE